MEPSKISSAPRNLSIALIAAVFFLGLAVTGSVFTAERFSLESGVVDKAEQKCGKEARKRLVAWEALLNRRSGSDMRKLRRVNNFFNKTIFFVNDIELYGAKDYWATPVEFLCHGAGDCEDYAIAKYFSLKTMGVEDEKLRIAYVKSLTYNEMHMVMAYYSTPSAEPLILCNQIDEIKPASERKDLVPIFTFNVTGLWLAHERGQGKLAGKSSRLSAWTDLQQRMASNNIK